MKRIELAVFIGMIFAIIAGSISGFAADVDEIRQNMLRLHIIANSDSAQDQELKLKVRDRVLKETGELFYNKNSLSEARDSAEENLEAIKKAAEDEIEKNGYNYNINAEITEMFFEPRVYDGITLPAGNYNAIRITIGAAKGENWWCVLYPPLCVPAAQNKALSKALDKKQVDIIEEPQRYEVRFALLDFFSKIGKSKDK